LVESIPQKPAKARQQAKPKTAAAPTGAVVESGKSILDPCCGSKMFWFDRNNTDVLFGDIRNESHILCDGRSLEVNPDIDLDFRDMPFKDGSFKLVVFDPPHFRHAGKQSWTAKKYGVLGENWRDDLKLGFSECFRVLANDGVLIFKWSEIQIKTSEILKLTPHKPLFGHKSGLRSNTHWICFMKRNYE
jgi:SAM-dependent methyltransferase